MTSSEVIERLKSACLEGLNENCIGEKNVIFMDECGQVFKGNLYHGFAVVPENEVRILIQYDFYDELVYHILISNNICWMFDELYDLRQAIENKFTKAHAMVKPVDDNILSCLVYLD